MLAKGGVASVPAGVWYCGFAQEQFTLATVLVSPGYELLLALLLQLCCILRTFAGFKPENLGFADKEELEKLLPSERKDLARFCRS